MSVLDRLTLGLRNLYILCDS